MANRIAIIGGGKIGEALLAGLISSGKPTRDLVVAERSKERADEIAEEYGVLVTDLPGAVEHAAVVVLAIKPTDVDEVTATIAGVVDEGETERLTVSLVAGVPTERYERALPAGSPVVRVMPNTPMLVNEAMSAVSPGRYADDEHVATVVELLSAVGKVVVVPERQMDAVTAVSGSGPAYAFLVAEALIDAGVSLGLSRKMSTQLVTQTVRGAGILLTDSGVSPADLRAAVTSPGGTTAAAVRELERINLRTGFYEAAHAAARASARSGSVESGPGVETDISSASD
ncbi:pyrroline-5-carboxylate reductase [Williamsia sterculiae]|uniref:Pyrroline-5-carboxylate reductase n=1 Tax=Williamsia sterculiae TaxID=1344003 RepID=A0A1N7CWB4_9NOCA|nr:pyrroline-5-carboxylate reductase [Williamsia sterculiae]SIR67765.1 pyrroline-5-carboxylate reductase [Williamsia sterculiae]